MTRRRKRRIRRPGLAPGTLLPPETPPETPVRIRVIHYTADTYSEHELATLEQCFPFRDTPGITWINVDALHDINVLKRLGEHYGLHPLALEDVHNIGQRSKLDEFDDHLFIMMNEVKWTDGLETEQVGLFLGRSFVITFQETPGDAFDPVRERLRKGGGRIRTAGADYLTYALLDALIDQTFPVLEKLGDHIERLEEQVVEDPSRITLGAIRDVKRDLLLMRRTVWPQREVIHALQREDSRFVERETRVFVRDMYDHVIQILDMIESFRELAASMLDVYLSSLSNRMNEVMKVLTIISTIFIPLMFLTGVYGMNFDTAVSPWNMPELKARYGYPSLLGVMALTVLGLLYYFRRKRWF